VLIEIYHRTIISLLHYLAKTARRRAFLQAAVDQAGKRYRLIAAWLSPQQHKWVVSRLQPP